MKRFAAVALLFFGTAGALAEPHLQFHSDPAHPNFTSVDVKGLDAHLIQMIKRSEHTDSHWRRVFSVRVQDAAMETSAGPMPGVLGTYEVLGDRVRFTPRYPLTSGLGYRAAVDLDALLPAQEPALSSHDLPTELTLSFSLPRTEVPPSTVVYAVFPSADVLPENLLRFYVHFSSPMQNGWLRDHIHLRRADGQRVEAALLDLSTELWDPSMQRLTLLLDPGRIKRGVGPNVEGGAPLRQGERYTLTIDAGMKDANGNTLREGFTKTFSVAAASRERVTPKAWSFVRPATGTRELLELGFPTPLDRAMLARVIRIVGADGQPVVGSVSIDRRETRWAFTPSAPWRTGPHHVLVETTLEDISGNNVIAPFDVDVRGDEVNNSSPTVVLAFEPTTAQSVTTHNRDQIQLDGTGDAGVFSGGQR